MEFEMETEDGQMFWVRAQIEADHTGDIEDITYQVYNEMNQLVITQFLSDSFLKKLDAHVINNYDHYDKTSEPEYWEDCE